MRARSFLTLEVSPLTRDAVVGALGPEVRSPPEGTSIVVRGVGGDSGIGILIESNELSNHRAALNSYLGLLQAAVESLEGPLEKHK